MSLLAPLFRAIDAPARETLFLEKRPLFASLPPALLGAAMIAASALAASYFFSTPPTHAFAAKFMTGRGEVLPAVFEALAIVFPSAIILAAYLELRISPRAFVAALGIALLISGVVAFSTLPLIAYLALVARARPMIAPGMFVPFLIAGAIAATLFRIVRALDPRMRARFFGGAVVSCFLAAFFFRAFDRF